MAWSRRSVLGLGAGGLAAGMLPRPARAAVAGRDLRFVFVVADGGWDPTRVFAPLFDQEHVSMEPDAEPTVQGDLTWVDHPDRPSVTRFFSGWGQRSVILNGLVVHSLSHDVCMQRLLTGGTVAAASDWPSLLAAARADQYALPQVIVEGPSYPGLLGGLVTRVGATDTVQRLLDGSLLAEADGIVAAPSSSTLARMDDLVARMVTDRADASSWATELALLERYEVSLQRARSLQSVSDQLAWAVDDSLSSQVGIAVDLLRTGVCRCVSLAELNSPWDSHADNDEQQSDSFETLFSGLVTLMEALDATPGPMGGSLADETVVCVLSEMGRTPQLNNGLGKDHWSHTSAMLVGPGITGGRVVGGFDQLFYGMPVDHQTAQLRADGRTLGTGSLGATLLALGDVDPGDALPDAVVLEGILA